MTVHRETLTQYITCKREGRGESCTLWVWGRSYTYNSYCQPFPPADSSHYQAKNCRVARLPSWLCAGTNGCSWFPPPRPPSAGQLALNWSWTASPTQTRATTSARLSILSVIYFKWTLAWDFCSDLFTSMLNFSITLQEQNLTQRWISNQQIHCRFFYNELSWS